MVKVNFTVHKGYLAWALAVYYRTVALEISKVASIFILVFIKSPSTRCVSEEGCGQLRSLPAPIMHFKLRGTTFMYVHCVFSPPQPRAPLRRTSSSRRPLWRPTASSACWMTSLCLTMRNGERSHAALCCSPRRSGGRISIFN